MFSHRTFLVSVLAFYFLCPSAMAKMGGGVNFLVSSPQEEFANVSDLGFGVSGKFFATPPEISLFALRIDFAWVSYGSETKKDIHIPGTDLYVDVNTKHESWQLTIGPQLTAPGGPSEFYFSPMLGIYNYSTTEEIEGTEISEKKWSTTKFGWNVGGGMTMKIKTLQEKASPPMVIGIDIGVKYHTVKNIIPSEVTDRDRDANDLTFHVGLVLTTK